MGTFLVGARPGRMSRSRNLQVKELVDIAAMNESIESHPTAKPLLHQDECFAVMGACFEVYRQLGCGFLEAVYQECLEIEFRLRGIHVEREVPIPITYKQHILNRRYSADFICCDVLVLELKTVSALTGEHRAQLINYLHAANRRVGLLVNFGHFPGLEWERLVV